MTNMIKKQLGASYLEPLAHMPEDALTRDSTRTHHPKVAQVVILCICTLCYCSYTSTSLHLLLRPSQ